MNPFRHRETHARRAERAALQLFRAATYFIVLCGALIIGTIAVKGVGALTKSTFPYINFAFLTEAPETLHVFEHNGRKMEMGDREYRAFKESLKAEELKAEKQTDEARIQNHTSSAASEPSALQPFSPSAFSSEAAYVYSAGGILPNIIGTILLVVGSMTIALVLGVASAIYLNEYARQGPVVNMIRLAVLNLAGVPSIVFGLFGFGMFVIFFGWNVSLMAGWFTLAFMVLPVVITASEEALKAVPRGFREGSLALGATKWQTIRKSVLPYALPGILTSSILGIARVAGETAPIMFTAAYVVRDQLPWQVSRAADFFFQGVMALPYHIYVVSSKIPQNEYTERVQYGTAFVFLVIVALIAAASIILRNRLRKKHSW